MLQNTSFKFNLKRYLYKQDKIHGYMKLFIAFSIIICLVNTKPQGKHFKLSCKVIGQQTGYLSLTYIDCYGKTRKDSSKLINGYCYFKGNIIEPTLSTLRGDVKSNADDDSNAVSFFIEPSNISVEVTLNHFKQIKVIGSKTQIEYASLNNKISAIENSTDSFFSSLLKIDYQFINEHPDSYVSAFVLSLLHSRLSLDSVKLLYNKLDFPIQKSLYGKEVKETIEKTESNSPGKMAKEFTTIDLNGNSINLSNFQGKYVLLDFWASWCIPCRQSTPHIIELFKEYHNRGFDIIGIAEDDDNPNVWKQAIKKDGIDIWNNILSGMKVDKNGEIDKSQWINDKYGVQVLPTKILIDKKGIIIGRYEDDDDTLLDQKLSEIFK